MAQPKDPCQALPLAVALDLDGTLLSDGHLGEANRQAVSVLSRHGIRVIIATGKHPLALWPYARSASLVTGPHIALSGASITSDAGRSVALLAEIPAQDARAVAEELRRLDLAFAVFATDAIRVDARSGAPGEPLELLGRLERLGEPATLEDDPLRHPAPVGKILTLLRSGDPREALVTERAPLGVHALRSGPFFLDLGPAGHTKGTALVRVAADLDLSLERIWAMGDSDNDIALLAAAGFSVSFEGAPLSLLRHADRVVPPGPRAVHDALRSLLPCLFDPETARDRAPEPRPHPGS